MFHPEKVLSAQTRYMDEINRIVGVLDTALSQRSSGWLVGDKMSYADLFFVMWNEQMASIFAPFPDRQFDAAKFPHFQKWWDAMRERPSVKKALEDQKVLIADMYAGKYP